MHFLSYLVRQQFEWPFEKDFLSIMSIIHDDYQQYEKKTVVRVAAMIYGQTAKKYLVKSGLDIISLHVINKYV